MPPDYTWGASTKRSRRTEMPAKRLAAPRRRVLSALWPLPQGIGSPPVQDRNPGSGKESGPRRGTGISILRGILCTVGLFAWVGAAIPQAEAAAAVEVCDGYVEFVYANPQSYHSLGDIARPRLLLGAGLIQGGTHLAVNRVRFELDCRESGVPCSDAGNLMSYVGNIRLDMQHNLDGGQRRRNSPQRDRLHGLPSGPDPPEQATNSANCNSMSG